MSQNEKQLLTVEQANALPTITPMVMMQQAQLNGADVAVMKELFALQVKYEENEAKKAFYRAFAAFKSEAISIAKDATVNFRNNDGTYTNYKHASIGNVIETVTPVLSKFGLSVGWDTVQEGGIKVTCRLTHELGFSIETSLSAGKDSSGKKNDIQQLCSTQTYLQRYTVLSILGLATALQDDDGAGSESGGDDGDGFMADAKFQELWPSWEAAVQSKKMTTGGLVDFVVSKGHKLSPGQIKNIESIVKE